MAAEGGAGLGSAGDLSGFLRLLSTERLQIVIPLIAALELLRVAGVQPSHGDKPEAS